MKKFTGYEEVEFQFTPLREGRLLRPSRHDAWYTCFNSRPCVRGDILYVLAANLKISFNSRPCVRGDGSIVAP